ncbi:MAG: nucleoside deaminase [Cyanobium sp. MAG06]|nr:nucleoside deaminase [Cyanobium sp. MAG06]
MANGNNIELLEESVKEGLIGVSNNHGGPFGAIIVRDGKIIGRGHNRVTSTNDPTAHAEITAIRDACKNENNFHLSGAIIYTSCEPCLMCLSAIY